MRVLFAFEVLENMDINKRKNLILKLMREDLYVPMKEKELAVLLQVKPENRPLLKKVLDELLLEEKIVISKRGKYLATKGKRQKAIEGGDNKSEFNIQDRKEKRRLRKSAKPKQEVIGKSEKSGKVKIIRESSEPGMDVLAIVKSFNLPYIFDEATLAEADKIASVISYEDTVNRLDLRKVTTVTMDGIDAKDLDDAITIKKEGTNFRLGVHIADVAHYVREDSALDHEARLRGTSVYLVDRVIPMLPPVLSNGICSLNAGEDRLALSCIMLVSPQGEVLEHEIRETVINVNRRMTYEAVKDILTDKNSEVAKEYHDLVPMFELMEELAANLRKKRKKRGAIDFEFPECKILVDEKGVPYNIFPYMSNTATRIIEEFMLLANETVAGHYFQLKSPFIYRTHEDPEPDKIEQLKISLGNFGFKMGGSQAKRKLPRIRIKGRKREVEQLERVKPRDIQRILKQVAGTPYEATIGRLALRSMKRAEYSPEETSHFGLASPCYCHFTSPIRRYPDLQIHRIIKEQLTGQFSKVRRNHYHGILTEVAKQSSERERRGEETEREVEKLKKAEYMENHLGEIYDGVVCGVTAWGLYVELPNTVEGLVHIRTIPDDYYIFDEQTLRLVGRRNGVSFRLGQPVKVWVKAADKWSRLIDFELV